MRTISTLSIASRSGIRRLPWRICGITLTLIMASGCAQHSRCDDADTVHTGSPRPPRACIADGCSVAPDFNFTSCCNRHDARYWLGGSADERVLADQEFSQCVAAKEHPVLAKLYYLGVRVGGTPYLPTPWRWGFGWRYPRGYGKD